MPHTLETTIERLARLRARLAAVQAEIARNRSPYDTATAAPDLTVACPASRFLLRF